MYKKTVKYEDLDGNEQEETLYFNYSVPQILETLAKLHVDVDNIQDYVQKLSESGDVKKMIEFIHTIIVDGYGQRSEDAKRFIKNDKIKKDFEESVVFDQVFMNFLNNPKEFETFITATTHSLNKLSNNSNVKPLTR